MYAKKESTIIHRREFCKTFSCAALGVFAVPGVKHLYDKTKTREGLFNQEDNVPDSITGVKLKVISQKGSCDAGHKVGDEVIITENGVEGKVCIHALYSVMPKAFAFLFGAEFTWLKDKDVSTHACPDAYNPLIFQVERIREK